MKIKIQEAYVALYVVLNSFSLWLVILAGSFLKPVLSHFPLSVHLIHVAAYTHVLLALVHNSSSEEL